MQNSSSQFQLFAEARSIAAEEFGWHFVLRAADHSLHLDVSDQEAEAPLERLELLAVVRGLEALDQPSRVLLLTPSRYVNHGLRYGLTEWREAGWLWESFGQMTPIKHEDLWRRVDQALQFHRVQCRTCRIDAAHTTPPIPVIAHRNRPRAVASLDRVPARRANSSVRAVLASRETVEVTNLRTPWLSLRQRVAGVLLGLGQAIAPQSAAATVAS